MIMLKKIIVKVISLSLVVRWNDIPSPPKRL